MKVREKKLTKSIFHSKYPATSVELEDVRTKCIGVLSVAIAVSAGSLLSNVPFTGKIYFIIALAVELTGLFLYCFKNQEAFDYVHYQLIGPIMWAGVFWPGRQVAWATLVCALLFMVVWLTYDGRCIMKRDASKAALSTKWGLILLMFLCTCRLLTTRKLPWWSWIVGATVGTIMFSISNFNQGESPMPKDRAASTIQRCWRRYHCHKKQTLFGR